MTDKLIRWGILSTAQIARKNWKAIRNSGNSTVTAVASRDVNRAQQFINECQAEISMPSVPKALGSYEALLASSEVDAVYIPLPTGLRKEWVIRAAEAGKHVLCEKPCAISAADLGQMIEACRKNKVQFMDGVMFMHSGRLDRMRQVLEDGTSVGALKRITSAFCFRAPDEFFKGNIRAQSGLEPAGCVGDLGWYCIRLALWVMKGQLPKSVAGRVLNEVRGVPTEFSGELFFDHGISSGFYCSFLTHNEQWAYLSGTSGYLRLTDFVVPFFGCESKFDTNNAVLNFGGAGCDHNMEAHWRDYAVSEYSNSHPTSQETNMIQNFARQVRSGALNAVWPEIALKTQQVMDACLKSAQADGKREALG